jgi:predicted AAA+ superfamily ATPase
MHVRGLGKQMDPWYKIVTPRKEVREGRSFSPDEFAIALEQVVTGTAPEDYRNPLQFFSRTCFTRALKEHAGMVLRRLAGQTGNTAPVPACYTIRRRQNTYARDPLPSC